MEKIFKICQRLCNFRRRKIQRPIYKYQTDIFKYAGVYDHFSNSVGVYWS